MDALKKLPVEIETLNFGKGRLPQVAFPAYLHISTLCVFLSGS